MDVIGECMNMIAYSGEAKSLAIQAIRLARKKDFEEAFKIMEKANESLNKAHQSHTELLVYEANNNDLNVSLFMVHSADHLNSADTVKILAEEMIEILKESEEKHA